MPLLSVRNLKVAFGAKEAVRELSFDVPAGATMALVGESGSGKSATLRLGECGTCVSGSTAPLA